MKQLLLFACTLWLALMLAGCDLVGTGDDDDGDDGGRPGDPPAMTDVRSAGA